MEESKIEKTKKFTIELLIYNIIIHKEETNFLKIEENKEFIDKERIDLDIPINYKKNKYNQSNEYTIQISDLKKELIKKGYPITTSKLYIFLTNINIDNYIYINDDQELLNSSMISDDNIIKLKLQNYVDSRLINDTFMLLKNHFSELEEQKNEKINEKKINQDRHINIPKKGIEKEIDFNKRKRKIGDIVKNVYTQRMLFNGFYNDEGKKIKFELKEASDIVGVPKKTLDDYLKQIRFAREKGFDFNKNKDKPISFLRDFNKNRMHENKDNFKSNEDIENSNKDDSIRLDEEED